MNMTVPSITAFYAALLGLLGAGLTVNVIVNRVGSKVDAGDGGVAKLRRRSAPMPILPSRPRWL
jgi:uncharacterized membrane protein YecN with MAPEG domain